MIFWNLFMMLVSAAVIVANSIWVFENTSPLKTGVGIVAICISVNCFIMELANLLDCLL